MQRVRFKGPVNFERPGEHQRLSSKTLKDLMQALEGLVRQVEALLYGNAFENLP